MSLLCVENASVVFSLRKNQVVKALDQVSFTLQQGEVLGIVGESGCGKSTLARTIMRLQPLKSGRIIWQGDDLATLSQQEQCNYRQDVQLIFQDPLDALNPRMTVAQIIAEPLLNLKPTLSKVQVQQQINNIIVLLGMSKAHLNRFPHEFSGGQCQRIGIARAMIVKPKLLVCDEPVSALDVSVQAQILNLLMDLKQQTDLSMLFISHDLSVVRYICDRLLVLYKGQVVEEGDVEQIYQHPRHSYTKKLLASIPLIDPHQEKLRIQGKSNA
ncbi:MAG TPA: ATP-binding cassette domain-containing protein [Thiothrix sp.]|nr:ATP-binding cassette domain-containing protein [Thiothrix sp.]